MKSNRKQVLFTLRRVHDFLNAEARPEPLATPIRDLAGVIGRLETFGARQEEHHRRMQLLTTQLQAQGRRVRGVHMRAIILAARAILPRESQDAIALEHAARLPRYKADYEQIVLAARGVAATTDPYRDQLAAAGLGPDFLTNLLAAADALVALVGARALELERRMAATEGVETEARRGVALTRFLDVLVRPTLEGNPSRLVEWERVIRRARPPQAAELPVAPGGESARAA